MLLGIQRFGAAARWERMESHAARQIIPCQSVSFHRRELDLNLNYTERATAEVNIPLLKRANLERWKEISLADCMASNNREEFVCEWVPLVQRSTKYIDVSVAPRLVLELSRVSTMLSK